RGSGTLSFLAARPRVSDLGPERQQLAVFVSWVRWAGIALAAFLAFFARPQPVSVKADLAIVAAMTLYNLPSVFARRLQPMGVERALLMGLAGDVLAVTGLILLSANDPQDLTFTTFFVVAVEAAVVYRWAAMPPFIVAAV